MIFSDSPGLLAGDILQEFLNAERLALHFNTDGSRLGWGRILESLGVLFGGDVGENRVVAAGSGGRRCGRGRLRLLRDSEPRGGAHYRD